MTNEEFIKLAASLHHPLDDDPVFKKAEETLRPICQGMIVDNVLRTSRFWEAFNRKRF